MTRVRGALPGQHRFGAIQRFAGRRMVFRLAMGFGQRHQGLHTLFGARVCSQAQTRQALAGSGIGQGRAGIASQRTSPASAASAAPGTAQSAVHHKARRGNRRLRLIVASVAEGRDGAPAGSASRRPRLRGANACVIVAPHRRTTRRIRQARQDAQTTKGQADMSSAWPVPAIHGRRPASSWLHRDQYTSISLIRAVAGFSKPPLKISMRSFVVWNWVGVKVCSIRLSVLPRTMATFTHTLPFQYSMS